MNAEAKEPQGQPPDRPPLREVSPEELRETLEKHREWVESGGEKGERADLSGVNLDDAILVAAGLHQASLLCASLKRASLIKANLREANLGIADLSKANLIEANLQGAHLFGASLRQASLMGANLQKANLVQADLQGAILREANLQEAELLRATLQEADLQDANLTNAKGLLAGQLAGANVSGAKLPEAIGEFEGLKIVQETSSNAQKIFISMLLGCVYSWLTIATTTDVRLLTNSASSPLPIIGAQIPIVGFYIAAPILLLGLYIYFHLYLQRLWEGLAELPAVFPDGRPLDKRADPWLLIGLVRAYFVRLKDDRPPLSRLQVVISVLLAWWVVPATLLWFWLRYLPRHDWAVTGLHILLLAISIGAAIFLHRLAAATFRGEDKKPFRWKKAWNDAKVYKRGAVFLGIGGIFFLLSFGAIDGVLYYIKATDLKATDIRIWVPRAFWLIGYSPFANLEEVDVSSKPANWTGQKEKEKEELPLVKGAPLRKRNLRYANAYRTFFVNADLHRADLDGAYLREADLRGADLSYANLHKADLRGVNFEGSNLQGADLRRTALQGANLRKVDLKGADLGWANLVGADLQEAILGGAYPEGGGGWGANFQGADLRWANLTGATGLTREQIESAIIDEKTRLPDYLKAPAQAKPKDQ